MLTVPLPIETTPDVLRFCHSLYARQDPIFVPVRPVGSAVFAECFPNVLAHVRENGGALRYGWDVSVLEGVFGEAEFHGIWCSPDGELVDITPKASAEDRILFQPDDDLRYDSTSRKGLANRFMAFTDDPLVLRYIELARYRAERVASVSPGSTFSVTTDFWNRLRLTQLELFRKYRGLDAEDTAAYERLKAPRRVPKGCVGRNETCPCGSGKKHKKCCGA